MSVADVKYKEIIKDILEEGASDASGEVRPVYSDGTPAHSYSIFGVQTKFEPGEIPVITSKKTPIQSSINEVVHAFFRMGTNKVKDFEELGIGYWGEWQDEAGTIGNSYGKQLRRQKERITDDSGTYELNQVDAILHRLEHDPFSRRIMFSYWRPDEVHLKSLQECAYSGQFNVRPNKDGELQLDFLLIQRSVDVLHGLPSNWAGYYALQATLAELLNFKVGSFTHQMGNVHLYDNQMDLAEELLSEPEYEQPGIYVNPNVKDFYKFRVDDVKYTDYKPGKSFRADIAI